MVPLKDILEALIQSAICKRNDTIQEIESDLTLQTQKKNIREEVD